MRSKLSQNNVFHSFAPNPSFSEIFNNFDQVWLSFTQSRFEMGPKTLILIQLLERVETNVIAKIVKLSF